ncbi:MAG: 3-methyladenine DNA glycosylase, partial [Cyclonatronaceae bacterium]
NMDLYKWAYKMQPWISSHLMLAAFKLACKARLLDMQAGPYDLRELGYTPLPIETEAGRQEYKIRQAAIWKEAAPLREALINAMETLLKQVETDSNTHPSP